MMALYNLTAVLQNSSDVVSVLQGVNTHLLYGWLGILFLLGTTIIMFVSFIGSTGDTSKSLAAASFNAFVVAIFLSALQLIKPSVLMLVLVLAGATVAFTWKNSS